MATSIGTLALKFTTDTSGVNSGINSVQRKIGQLGSGLASGLGLGFIAGGTAAITSAMVGLASRGIGAVVSGLTEASERVDRLAKVSDRLEIPIGTLQRIGHAADLAGADFGQITKAVQKMLITVGTGGLPVEERLKQIAKQISAIDDPGQRAARAVKVFGKEGAEMLNVLAELPDNLDRAGSLVDRFGLGLARLEASGVEAMNDAWTDVQFVLDGIFNKTLAAAAPVVAAFLEFTLEQVEALGRGLAASGLSWDTVTAVAIEFGAIGATVMEEVAGRIRLVVAEGQLLFDVLKGIVKLLSGDLAGAQGTLDDMGKRLQEMSSAGSQVMRARSGMAAFDFIQRAEDFQLRLRGDNANRGTGGRLGGDIVAKNGKPGEAKSESRFAGALERGSLDTVRAVTNLSGNPIGAVAQNTKDMLLALKPMQTDIAKIARRFNEQNQIKASS